MSQIIDLCWAEKDKSTFQKDRHKVASSSERAEPEPPSTREGHTANNA
jgi:hypothetical protein